MERYWSTILIVFEEGFWVGYFEHANRNGQEYQVARHIFGPEPTDAQLGEFILRNGPAGLCWSTERLGEDNCRTSKSPKRRSREAARAVRHPDGASRTREAVKASRAQRKEAGAKQRKAARTQEQEENYARRQEKRKRKHRGR